MNPDTSAMRIAEIAHEQKESPRANPLEQIPLPRGGRYEDLFGLWPGEIDDGFEEYVQEMRNGPRRRGMP